MLFSLKLQRDNRKNALTVDPVKGKTGKKLHFSPHCGDETTTYYNRAFGKGFLLYFHISVCAGSTAGLSFPCFFVSWAVAFVRYPFGGPVSCWCAKNGDGADTEDSSRNMWMFFTWLCHGGLFHLHNMMKIRPFHQIFFLAESLAKAFGWLFWLAVFKFVADTRFQLERKSSLEIIWRSRNNSSKLDFM